MEKIKKILHYLSSMLLYALLMILVVVVLMVVITIGDRVIALKNHQSKAPLFSAYVIISPSMVPNINVYDAVITARVPQNRIDMYDVITFLSKEIETHGVPITHRVVGILKTEDGERAYRTKGDNNNNEDKAIILQSEVIGKVLFRIPMLGYVRTFVTSKIGFLISVILPITASLFLEIWRLIGRRKKKLQEQQKNQLSNLTDNFGQDDLTIPLQNLENVENAESIPTAPPIVLSSPATLQSEAMKTEPLSIVDSSSPVNSISPPVSPPTLVKTELQPVTSLTTLQSEAVKVESPSIVASPTTLQPKSVKTESQSNIELIEDIPELLDSVPLVQQPKEEITKKSEDDDDIEVI